MSALPEGWCHTDLGSLIERIEASLNVKCEERPPTSDEKGLVKISAVTWGRFDENQSKTLPIDAPVAKAARIRAGDLLFSRANTIELVGATVLVDKIDKALYLSDKVLRLVVPQDSKRWVNYAMKTTATRKAIQEASSGNQLSMRNISQDKLRQIAIPLAPLPEQKRIADKLDTVLARVDACRDRLDRLPALLKRFRQSILTAATSGRLTSDWRNEQKIEPWTSTTVGALIQKIEAGLNVKCDERPPEDGEIGLVKISAVTWGSFDERESKTLPNGTAISETTRIRRGDFLISRANTLELVGACVLVQAVERKLYLSDKVLRLVMPDKWKPWLLFVLRSDIGRKQIEALASGNQLSMRNLSQANLRSIEVPLPSDNEIVEIVRRVDTLFAFADRLEARLATARRQVGQLTPALLAKAFRGELVPQDPADEPASELLKRLATSRADAPKLKRGGRRASIATNSGEPTC